MAPPNKNLIEVSEGIKIRKHSGEFVEYSRQKLKNSLGHSDISEDTIEQVASAVDDHLYNGISTKEIYQFAHRYLKKQDYIHASRYKLKRAIQELGPTGYPFEQYIAELMREMGYQTQVGQVLQGRCVSHEVDVLAEKDNTLLMMECKFHNKPGYKSDVKVPLYIHSRFNDLNAMWQSSDEHKNKKTEGWVVTNSRFTTDAIDYGRCAGLKMLSWDYPEQSSLKKLIHKHHMYPITSLHSLSKRDKEFLISEGVVSTKMLCENFGLLQKLNLANSKIQKIISEANLICEV